LRVRHERHAIFHRENFGGAHTDITTSPQADPIGDIQPEQSFARKAALL